MSYYEEIKKTHPYTAEYLKKYGMKALASTFEVPPKFKNAEEMYKECIRQGKRWEKITIQAPKDAML